MSKINRPEIGGHVSAAGGLSSAIDRAEAIGAEAIQIFGSSPKRWSVLFPASEEIEKFRVGISRSNIKKVFLHAAYLVNLASPDDIIRLRSIKSLVDHIKIAEMIQAEGLIFHIGSGKEGPKDEAMAAVIEGVKKVITEVPGRTKLILENSAGGGARLGNSIKDVSELVWKIDSTRVGICFDTAHAFEAGMIEEYSSEVIKEFFDNWEKEISLDNLLVLHINDSKTKFDSHHDKHDNIGGGYIGLDGFKNLAKETRLFDKPWILEVPGFNNGGPDKRNIDTVKDLFE